MHLSVRAIAWRIICPYNVEVSASVLADFAETRHFCTMDDTGRHNSFVLLFEHVPARIDAGHALFVMVPAGIDPRGDAVPFAMPLT